MSSSAASSDEVSVSSPAGISMLAVICSTESCTVRVMSSRRFSSMGGSSRSPRRPQRHPRRQPSSAAASSGGAAAVASCSAGALSSAGVSGSACSPSSAGGFLRCFRRFGGGVCRFFQQVPFALCRFGGGILGSGRGDGFFRRRGLRRGAASAAGCLGQYPVRPGPGCCRFSCSSVLFPKILLVLPHRGKNRRQPGPGCTQ